MRQKDRATQGKSELISLEVRLRIVIEIISSVRGAVAQEVEDIAMDFIGTGLGDHVDDVARNEAKLC